MVYEPIYHNIVSVCITLNLKRSLKTFLKETMAAGKNPFTPELNEKEVIELLKNATPGSMKKIFQGKKFKHPS